MRRFLLKRELQKAGAEEKELGKLLHTAQALHMSELPTLSPRTQKRIEAISGSPSPLPLVLKLSVSAGAVGCLALLVAAQYAMPGSALYRVKQGTEAVRALVQPKYKDAIVDERKKELELLEQQQATPEIIEQVMTDYESAVEKSSRQKQDAERNWQESHRWNRRDNSESDRRSDDGSQYSSPRRGDSDAQDDRYKGSTKRSGQRSRSDRR